MVLVGTTTRGGGDVRRVGRRDDDEDDRTSSSSTSSWWWLFTSAAGPVPNGSTTGATGYAYKAKGTWARAAHRPRPPHSTGAADDGATHRSIQSLMAAMDGPYSSCRR
jgi:hypothetical protein